MDELKLRFLTSVLCCYWLPCEDDMAWLDGKMRRPAVQVLARPHI
jgi:hypothetical protein